ncbi:toxic anion resistance protein [Ktedonospora formicarum]|uniref:toxic anion resistance protein n=1 Tax=Ktedonospora formicarum TaxID=2778364 RepID=UPI001C68B045|nr:toxic anion resistance protein [Ktedonospora formicarum]
MAEQEPIPSFKVSFPMVPGAGSTVQVPPTPKSEADPFMSQYAQSQQSRQQLVCKDLLDPQSYEQAQQYAKQLYPQMIANTQIMMAFGSDSVEGMNTLINRLLKEVEPVNIPELTQIMRGLNNEMRKIRQKYDVSNDKTREKLEKWANGVGGFFGRMKSLIQALMEDAMKLEEQIDRVKKELAGSEHQIIRNVGYYDQLYRRNEEEIQKVIAAIAVMEIVRDLAVEEGQSITVASSVEHQKEERKRNLAQFARNMEIKIAEYKNRLFVGWTTSPQVTNMRDLDVSLAQKLDLLMNLTIPVMLGTILQWRMMIQSMQAAQLEQLVASSANEWLTAYSQAGDQIVPLVAQAVETPTLTPATISAMAAAVERQSQAIVEAYEQGKVQRAENDDAMMKAREIISAATNEVSTRLIESQSKVVDALVRKAETPALPPPTQL